MARLPDFIQRDLKKLVSRCRAWPTPPRFHTARFEEIRFPLSHMAHLPVFVQRDSKKLVSRCRTWPTPPVSYSEIRKNKNSDAPQRGIGILYEMSIDRRYHSAEGSIRPKIAFGSIVSMFTRKRRQHAVDHVNYVDDYRVAVYSVYAVNTPSITSMTIVSPAWT